jgi:peptidoglycan/xylan/chitin deacetylase (PgdA/CDA1 family)
MRREEKGGHVNGRRAQETVRWIRRSAIAVATSLIALTVGWIGAPAPAAHAVADPITIVSIQFDDGTADQIDTLPFLQAHGMVATFYVNSGPVLAGDPSHMTQAQLTELFNAGNEIASHTVDHVNIQPLSVEDARAEVCTDRNNLKAMGFPVQSFAYPFGSFDAQSEAVVQACGFNSGRGVAGVSVHVNKDQFGETVPPVDPYATRTPPSTKKATKLSTLEKYVTNAEAGVQATCQTLWVQLVFHRFCEAHCGAYTMQPEKFTGLLDFLQTEVTAGRVSVQTTAQVIGGPENPPVPP